MKDPFSLVDEQSISQSLTVGRIATLACVLEVTAPKPGNVHRGADFEDVTFSDFLVSAVATGEVFDRPELSVGQYVLQAVQQTEAFVGTNTNLGIVLLLSPLVAAARLGMHRGQKQLCSELVSECLMGITPTDGRKVFEAIALAKPGGLGKAPMFDVNATQGDVDLMAAMKLAADRDSIAKQYTSGLGRRVRDWATIVVARSSLVCGFKFSDRVLSRRLDGSSPRLINPAEVGFTRRSAGSADGSKDDRCRSR